MSFLLYNFFGLVSCNEATKIREVLFVGFLFFFKRKAREVSVP